MLVLGRNVGEKIIFSIGELQFSMTVVDIRHGCRIRLGFDAPLGVLILRAEIMEEESLIHEKAERHKAILRIESEGGYYGPLQVQHSPAGYFIGRRFYNAEGSTEPGFRESQYYLTALDATVALTDGTFHRVADELEFLYSQQCMKAE